MISDLCYTEVAETPDEGGPMTSTIRCQHCNTEVQTKRPDLRKWCDACREAKHALAMAGHTVVCDGCEKPYYGADQKQARARTCYGCLPTPIGESGPDRSCVYCGAQEHLLTTLAICYGCIQQVSSKEAPRHHERVKRSLARKLAERAAV